MGIGAQVLQLPPAAFPALRDSLQRRDYARRYYAMVETENLGVTSRWVGQGSEPKPNWEYDDTERQRYLAALRSGAGLPAPVEPSQSDPYAEDRAAWARLKQQRRMRA